MGSAASRHSEPKKVDSVTADPLRYSQGGDGLPVSPKRAIALTGPARSGKTSRLLERYRAALAHQEPRSTLWLAPHWRAAAQIRLSLLGGSLRACFTPGVVTFAQFADQLLDLAPDAVRPLSAVMKRQLLRALIGEELAAGRLRHFRAIARTGGLVDLFGAFIAELKRLDIWPDRFRAACEARGMTAKDAEFLAIYEAYQNCLNAHRLYDAEGRFWWAKELARQGSLGPYRQLRLVVADGFTDFTPPQHEILELLSARSDELWISLPLEVEPGREDLFQRPWRTLDELRRRHPGLVEQAVPRPNSTDWPAMDNLERTLFAAPSAVEPARDLERLEILAASRQLGEVELIGRRIKRLLTQGDETQGGRPVRPHEIAVVFRTLHDVDPLIREVFTRLGVPVALESRPTLDRSTALAALVGLVRLDLDDWPFRRLLAVLTSSYFRPQWPAWQEGRAAVAVERIIRRLQIPRGRDELLGALERSIRRHAGRGDCSESSARRLSEMRVAYDLLRQLGEVLAALPQRGTLSDWMAGWRQLAIETGLLRVVAEEPETMAAGEPSFEHARVSDRAAWQQLEEVAASSRQLSLWLGGKSVLLDRREALETLLEVARSVELEPGDDESGRVRVLSAASVRALRIPYVFLAGLSEQSFPQLERQDRLYSEGEQQSLSEHGGLSLVPQGERNRDEMLRFYEAATRASQRVWFSYPALDAAAQPLSPSPYLEEVEQACGEGRIRRTVVADLSPIPADGELLCDADLRIKSVAAAKEGRTAELASLLREPRLADCAENLLAGLHCVVARQNRKTFGPAEGMLLGSDIRRELAARFGPERTFSATELESYATCGFRFYLDRVLEIEPLEELALAVDHLARGRMIHEALARFHERLNRRHGGPTSPAGVSEAECALLLDETLAGLAAQAADTPLEKAMAEIDRRVWLRAAAAYRSQHEAYDRLWPGCAEPPRPAWFEVSFGLPGCGPPPSTEEPLELNAGGRTIRVSGRIDRIDLGSVGGRSVFNIIDYKSGSTVRFDKEEAVAGTKLQLPLYAIAAEKLLAGRNAQPWQAGYWAVLDQGFRPKQALKLGDADDSGPRSDPDWESLRAKVLHTIGRLVDGMQNGQFPVFSRDDECTRKCPHCTICRIQQVRALEKRWPVSSDEA